MLEEMVKEDDLVGKLTWRDIQYNWFGKTQTSKYATTISFVDEIWSNVKLF